MRTETGTPTPATAPDSPTDEAPVHSEAPATTLNALAQRMMTNPETVERDLMKLVLTIIELLRQLMERQALRRVDRGNLTEEQEERVGRTLMILDDRMTELRERYGLTPQDLNLDLGPLGTLL